MISVECKQLSHHRKWERGKSGAVDIILLQEKKQRKFCIVYLEDESTVT